MKIIILSTLLLLFLLMTAPVLILKDKSCFGHDDDGVGTIYIPIKFCPECGRKLGR